MAQRAGMSPERSRRLGQHLPSDDMRATDQFKSGSPTGLRPMRLGYRVVVKTGPNRLADPDDLDSLAAAIGVNDVELRSGSHERAARYREVVTAVAKESAATSDEIAVSLPTAVRPPREPLSAATPSTLARGEHHAMAIPSRRCDDLHSVQPPDDTRRRAHVSRYALDPSARKIAELNEAISGFPSSTMSGGPATTRSACWSVGRTGTSAMDKEKDECDRESPCSQRDHPDLLTSPPCPLAGLLDHGSEASRLTTTSG